MYYNKNLEFLQQNAPRLYETAVNEKALLNLDIIELETDDFKLSYDGKTCYANSSRDQEREFKDMFSNVSNETEILVVFGIGNGRMIKYIQKNFKHLKGMFIIEPYLDVFYRFMRKNDFREVFKDLGEISFIVNKTPLQTSDFIIRDIVKKYNQIEISCTASYFSLLEKWFDEFKYNLISGLRVETGRLVTVHNSRYRWLRNTIYNLKQLGYQQEILKKYLEGKPAIIVSAGPSLNQHLPILNDLKDRAIIIAAGSAIKILSANGIEPHFRMAIDAQDEEALYDDEFFNSSSEIPLLYASQLADRILPLYEGNKFFMLLPTDLLGKYFYDYFQKDYDFVLSGASVVHSALDFLYKSKCEPIVFIGQDMCFYDNELYADGKSDSQHNYNPNAIIALKDIYGNEVHSLRNYLQIKYDYEGMIRSMDSSVLINATEGGLGIEGVENRTLKDVMDNELKKPLSFSFQELDKELEETPPFNIDEINECIDEIRIQINEIVRINDERLTRLEQLTADREKGVKLSLLWNDLIYIEKNLERQIREIPFYSKVILQYISVEAAALSRKYKKGDHRSEERIKNSETFYYNITSEVQIMCDVLLDWFDEVFNDRDIEDGR